MHPSYSFANSRIDFRPIPQSVQSSKAPEPPMSPDQRELYDRFLYDILPNMQDKQNKQQLIAIFGGMLENAPKGYGPFFAERCVEQDQRLFEVVSQKFPDMVTPKMEQIMKSRETADNTTSVDFGPSPMQY